MGYYVTEDWEPPREIADTVNPALNGRISSMPDLTYFGIVLSDFSEEVTDGIWKSNYPGDDWDYYRFFYISYYDTNGDHLWTDEVLIGDEYRTALNKAWEDMDHPGTFIQGKFIPTGDLNLIRPAYYISFKTATGGKTYNWPEDIPIDPGYPREVTLPERIPVSSGLSFTGWNTSPDGSGTNYPPGSRITTPADNMTLWAQWKTAGDVWYLVYDANGGEDAHGPQIIRRGTDAVLSDDIPKNGRMHFKGWARDPDAAEADYLPGDEIPYDSQKDVVVLYALWQLDPVERPIHISFDANGMAGAILPNSSWIEWSGRLQLQGATLPEGGDYAFKGWSKKPDTVDPEYTAGNSYSFFRDTVLYAIWAPVVTEYKVTLFASPKNSGSVTASAAGSAGGPEIMAKTGDKVTIKATAGAGYRFIKWQVTKVSGGEVSLTNPKKAKTTFTVTDKNIKSVRIKAIFEKKVSGTLLSHLTCKGEKGLKFTWTKITGADGYDIFFCKCGHNTKEKKIATVKSGKTCEYIIKGLKKSIPYKGYVRAYTGSGKNKKYVRTSPVVHEYTSGGSETYTNAAKVKITKPSSSSLKLDLKKKKTYKIDARVIKKDKDRTLMSTAHGPRLRYLSSNKNIAKVDDNGKITAKKKGKCKIYVYAINGARSAITVTVK